MNSAALGRVTICRRPLCFSALVAVICWAPLASAYRPFDGTDADVAELGQIELEIAPAGYRQEGSSRFVVAPALVANYGFAPRFEAVFEGRQDIQLNARQRPSQLQDIAFSVKSLLRRGSLQGGKGLSVALELGMLLPGFESRLGNHVGSIFSFRSPVMTLHLNLDNDILYSVRYQASASLIAEGPASWRVRPVAEGLVEREFDRGERSGTVAESLLVGGIARWTDAVSFDVGGRFARSEGRREEEARVGLTVGFQAW
jgi:hypothetical protein